MIKTTNSPKVKTFNNQTIKTYIKMIMNNLNKVVIGKLLMKKNGLARLLIHQTLNWIKINQKDSRVETLTL